VDFHPCWAEPRSLAHPVKNNLRGPRIAYTVCDLLPPSVYRPVSRSIPTSTARSVRSSSQSITPFHHEDSDGIGTRTPVVIELRNRTSSLERRESKSDERS
jgi:hypothetical protein